MIDRKAELRDLVLDILLKREVVTHSISQFQHLAGGVAEVLARRVDGQRFSGSIFPQQRDLDEGDWQLVQEIFWDLICERVISPGLNSSNPQLPWFRVHANAAAKLRKDA